MKRTAYVLKILSTMLLFCLGTVMMIMGFSGNGGNAEYNFWSSVDYKTYGGDAYTGIQNAAAATANQIIKFGLFFSEIIDNIYICVGAVLMLGSLYLFACALTDMAKDAEDDYQQRSNREMSRRRDDDNKKFVMEAVVRSAYNYSKKDKKEAVSQSKPNFEEAIVLQEEQVQKEVERIEDDIAKKASEEPARRAAEERARKLAEERAQREAEERARRSEEERMAREADESAKRAEKERMAREDEERKNAVEVHPNRFGEIECPKCRSMMDVGDNSRFCKCKKCGTMLKISQ